MEEKVQIVKERADKLIGNKKITTLIDEAELIKKLNEISQSVDETNYLAYSKTLDAIDGYLEEKEKLETQKKDNEFLKNLAKELREQQVRITDNSNPPLFVVENELGEDIYFVTRNALDKYCKCNFNGKKKVIEIPSNRSIELTELLEIVKRNF